MFREALARFSSRSTTSRFILKSRLHLETVVRVFTRRDVSIPAENDAKPTGVSGPALGFHMGMKAGERHAPARPPIVVTVNVDEVIEDSFPASDPAACPVQPAAASGHRTHRQVPAWRCRTSTMGIAISAPTTMTCSALERTIGTVPP